MAEALNILVIGAGAIGGYVGGSLALHGHRVTFVARPETAERLRREGLRLRLPGGEQRIFPEVADKFPQGWRVGAFDAALLAVKAYQTVAAVQPLLPFSAEMPPLVCLQNGVDNEPLLESLFGPEKVIAGTVTTAVARPAPGEVVVERQRGMGLAVRRDSPLYPLAVRLREAMDAAGLNPRLYATPASMKWSKLLTNLAGNATSAILDMTPAEVFAHPGLARLEIVQQREALRVMRALGARVISLPGAPVPLLAFAAQALPVALARRLLARAVGGARGGKMPSLYIDLHRNRKESEVATLNGAVAAHGARAGVSTPVNAALAGTLLALARGELPLNRFTRQPDELLAVCVSF